ncbi:MAG: hypothetical protein CM15mP8_1470 [Methanobacteriota archaeon]|nr:MAG: hypothetical protein CM15mP8_1470 [Euryarchaeota archaeon]
MGFISQYGTQITIYSWQIVGIIVALLAFYFGQYTGASMNPARTFGPNVVSGKLIKFPKFSLSTIIGGIIAAFLSKIVNTSNQA